MEQNYNNISYIDFKNIEDEETRKLILYKNCLKAISNLTDEEIDKLPIPSHKPSNRPEFPLHLRWDGAQPS